jgi:transketolase
MALNTDILGKAATDARGLAMDAVKAASSGHLGLPLGATEIGAVLFGHSLRYFPDDPHWLNRDRLVLSAGHGSMFLYGWLHLAGYNISIEDIKNFRQLHSRTPGHPEFGETDGIEATTGPLGQGVGNAVGMAVAAKMAEAHFNTPDQKIFDHKIICLAGDGCLQEGISSEASAFAGHFHLDNLILLYDSNAVTLDAMAKMTQSEDTGERYRAYGFDVQTVDGQNMKEFLAAFEKARLAQSGKPQFIICRTLIGKGIPEVAGTNKAHGEAGVKFVDEARKALGLPEERFYVSDEVRRFFTEHKESLKKNYLDWQDSFAAWKKANPELHKLLETGLHREVPKDLLQRIPEFDSGKKMSTRKAGNAVLQAVAEAMPLLISGSADLHGSTLNYIQSDKDFNVENRAGRNIRFGIREHGMCSILNGIGYYGLFRPSGATFLVFADYCRPPMRLAALAKLPITYIFTHDSVGVGEDGPTHEPVETVSSYRVMPNMDVIRPADPEETAGAFTAAMQRIDGPTLLALTRQDVPFLDDATVQQRREGVLKGGYIYLKEKGELKLILMGTGSEVQHAAAAAKQLAEGVRVVSLPCFERFDRQPESYRNEVLPLSCRKRISIEAGATPIWFKYVGLDGRAIGIDRFGLSAPGATVMKELGITAEHVVEVARNLGI